MSINITIFYIATRVVWFLFTRLHGVRSQKTLIFLFVTYHEGQSYWNRDYILGNNCVSRKEAYVTSDTVMKPVCFNVRTTFMHPYTVLQTFGFAHRMSPRPWDLPSSFLEFQQLLEAVRTLKTAVDLCNMPAQYLRLNSFFEHPSQYVTWNVVWSVCHIINNTAPARRVKVLQPACQVGYHTYLKLSFPLLAT
jgi:hypothetical protein